MNKMTHTKFNLNNFLFSMSHLIENVNSLRRNSLQRLSYISLKIASINGQDKILLSDLLSYSCICKDKYLKNNMHFLPFNNLNNLKSEALREITSLSLFFEEMLDFKNNKIDNKEYIINQLEVNTNFHEEYREHLLYLCQFPSFWLDLANENLGFKILDLINDFTIEYPYENLILLSKLFYNMSYTYMQREYQEDIGYKLKKIASYYNLDQKDSSRLIISGYLAYIGNCFYPKMYFTSVDLTYEQLEYIKSSGYFTYETLIKVYGFEDIANLSSSFGERIDGLGYPKRLKNSELNFQMRILSVVYHLQGLIEARNYRKKFSGNEILDILELESKKGILDYSITQDIIEIMHI